MKRHPPGPHRAARLDRPQRQSWQDAPVYQQLMAFLGVKDDAPSGRRPSTEARARSLVTALFLRAGWLELVRDEEEAWIEDWLSALGPTAADAGPNRAPAEALQRLLKAGASRADLTQLVRAGQEDLLRRLCEVLDGQRLELLHEEMPEVQGLSWQLSARRGAELVGAVLPLAPRVTATHPAHSPAPSPSELFMKRRPPGPGDDSSPSEESAPPKPRRPPKTATAAARAKARRKR